MKMRQARGSTACRRATLAVAVLLSAPLMARADTPTPRSADFSLPTTRYDHGILGDAVEYGGLDLRLSDGRRLRFILPDDMVFEDTAPRLADLDGDGAAEVIVVESSLTRGARLAVWGVAGRITATPDMGRPHRWLAPIGAADLDGDGKIEVAYVDRPHLARILRIWRFDAGKLTEVASAPDVANHRIGWSGIPGGIRLCKGQAPEMIAADGDWQSIIALRLSPGGKITRRRLGPYMGPASLDAAREACD